MTIDEARRAGYVDVAATGMMGWVGFLRPDGAFRQQSFNIEPLAPVDDHGVPMVAIGLLQQERGLSASRLCGWGPLASSSKGSDDERLPVGTRQWVRARYENVAPLAIAWAAIHRAGAARATEPGAPPTRAALYKMFELAGYRPDWYYGRDPRALRASQPVLLAAGRDPRRRAMTPRQRQRLLGANRRDCLGLRHLVLRASAEAEQRAAYLDAIYTVRDDARQVSFDIGALHSGLDALLSKWNAREWAHISACDPGLATLSAAENRRRSAALTGVARQRGYAVLEGAGQDRARRRPPEPTQFIVGIPKREARVLAREFGQWAIVTGRLKGAATLLWCLDLGADPLIVNQLMTLLGGATQR